MRLFRRRKWPRLDLYSPGGRGDIKKPSLADYDRLARTARDQGRSAVGRPGWMSEHRGRIRSLFAVVFGTEGSGVYRCLVTVVLDDGSGGSFTLDVSRGDYDALPDVTPEELVEMAHLHLLHMPPIELDPGQRETWEHPE
ncbi:hypothetical protein E1267_22370 [Nonomuraea longispora]|uniref:Uncharacterized protein n=1 Tax=Nonomuraea longispora TaxID=1848320 RepID=A0A4R4ND37_9ACTN|nr:hypothetical protein [Nonomuraea longispora]TDC04572.1 hypothetical protein E1267_22370 [Nonomuraea longispora]